MALSIRRLLLIFAVSGTLTTPTHAQTLGEALNAPELQWSSSPNLPWTSESAVSHDGDTAATSGSLAVGQTNWVETTITGPAAVTFWWKVSSSYGSGASFLSLEIGSIPQTRIVGETDWQQRCFYVPPGPQSVRWSYGQTVIYKSACGCLDQVSVSAAAAPAFLIQPTNQSVLAGASVTLAAAVTGTEPLSIQWQRNGSNLAGATNGSIGYAWCPESDKCF